MSLHVSHNKLTYQAFPEQHPYSGILSSSELDSLFEQASLIVGYQ